MSINFKVNLATVNYTDYIRVTASKVSAPTVVVWEDYIDTPVSNESFIIPDLDPENYFIRYYDAATIGSIGSLVSEILVNGLTGEYMYERRFYTVSGVGPYDPADGATSIIDPYLIDKTVTGVFKENFRYLEPTTEFTHDGVTGQLDIINGTQLSTDEKITLEIKYNTGNSSSNSSVGFYSGVINVTEATRTLLNTEANKRIRCIGTIKTQIITLPALASLSVDNGFYFDNSVGGIAIQVKVLTAGIDKIRFNGFDLPSSIFNEFWVSRGEHLLLRKFDDDFWEVILDYKGVQVGEKVTVGFAGHPNILTENGQLVDGDEYPRLWWWVNNVLPSTHKYVTNTVTGSFVPDPTKIGMFAIHSSLKKFRMPKTNGYTEKGLADFITYGTDTTNRPIDYPGGTQADMNKAHGHRLFGDSTGANGGVPYALNRINVSIAGAQRAGGYLLQTNSGSKLVEESGGVEVRTKNIGVIYGRRI